MKIFALESSCDETAAALVEDGVKEIASVVSSSADLHEITGGVVPEVAARKQVEYVVPVIEETLKKSADSLGFSDVKEVIAEIDALAVTVGPGLIGSLVVGVEAAKALSLAWGKPLIPVNHLVGHFYANWVDSPTVPQLPALVLIVSGGHTDLILMNDHGKHEYLGGTYDDAAGEAFDKTARLLGLSKYLGGASLSLAAASCKSNPLQGKLPRALIKEDNYDFSFSGLKTAVRRVIEGGSYSVEEVACEFEEAVVDVLVAKTVKAAHFYKVSSVIVGGGVSANKLLRTRLSREAGEIPVHLPPLKLTGDNAVYIASAAFFNRNDKPLSEIKAVSSLGVTDPV